MSAAFLKYITGLLLFGSNGVVASFISLGSYEIVLLRSFFGALVLLGIFLLSGRRFTAHRHKRDLLFVCLSGAAMAADWLFLFEAYARIGVSMGMLINYCGPAIVMALSPVVFKEKLTAQKIAALLAALAGVFLIGGGASPESFDAAGILCAVLSAFSYAAMVIFNKMSKEVTGFEDSVIQLITTCAVVAVYVWLRQGFAMDIRADEWLPILWLGVVNTGAGCYLYFSSIGSLPVHTVSICGYLEPLSAVVLSAIVLNEKMTVIQYTGALLMVFGALLGEGVIRTKRSAGGERLRRKSRS